MFYQRTYLKVEVIIPPGVMSGKGVSNSLPAFFRILRTSSFAPEHPSTFQTIFRLNLNSCFHGFMDDSKSCFFLFKLFGSVT